MLACTSNFLPFLSFLSLVSLTEVAYACSDLTISSLCVTNFIAKQCYAAAKPIILEPVMLVEMKVPTEFQGTVTGDINKLVNFFLGVCY